MATDTTKITTAADDLADKLTKGGSAAKTLGAEIANAIKSLDSRVAALEAGGGTQPPIEPPTTQNGRIENFTGANGGQFKVGGWDVKNQNPGKAWSMVKLDDYTIQFEIRSGDLHASDERDEMEYQDKWNEGVQSTLEEKFTVMPGPRVTASWFCLNQAHATTNVNPTYSPFWTAINTSDRLQIILQTPQGGNNYIWTQPQAIVRGKEYVLKAQIKFGLSNNGRIQVWLDGTQIVNFSGNVGATNSQYYWKVGAYRGDAPETTIVKHRNVHIVKV